jgi:peptide/nickel transport system substrate-binding protein
MDADSGRGRKRSKVLLPAAAAACALLAAACASSSAGGPGSPATASKILVVGAPQAPPTLDPTANAAQAIDEVVDYNVLQHLVQLAPDGAIVPVLATGYTLSADWSFLFNLASYSNGVILDPKTVSTLATNPVGTGPYTISGNVANYSTTLKTNPAYWGQKPGVAGVEFRYYTDPNAEEAALESGQIQVGNLPSPADLPAFKNNPGKYGVLTGLTNGKVQLTINNTAGPFKSLLVRQAVSYAINKNTVNQVASGGEGVLIGTDTVPSDPYYVNLAGLYPNNPAKAKQLLAQAGYPNGFSTTLTLPPYYYAQLAAPVIQQELAAVGIKVTIKNVAFPLWLSQVFTGGNFDLTIIDHAEARDVSNYGTAGYYWHYAGTSTVAAQLAAANAAPTQAQWIAGTKAVLTELADDAVNDWLYVLPAIEVYAKGYIGLPSQDYAESLDLSHASYGGSLPAGAAALGYTAS